MARLKEASNNYASYTSGTAFLIIEQIVQGLLYGRFTATHAYNTSEHRNDIR